ncbi:IS3 family transposase [Micromonospora carbonacea]|uniref:IS3 family transposase n=1 Tax=Micromonospora carbonacea TaxID=47853 RepID=UPI0035E3AF5F
MTQQAWPEHRGVHGARRLTAELHERGHRWNRKSVARPMRLAGIEGAHRRRRGEGRRKAASTATAPDLVQRQFTATGPNGSRAPTEHRTIGTETRKAPTRGGTPGQSLFGGAPPGTRTPNPRIKRLTLVDSLLLGVAGVHLFAVGPQLQRDGVRPSPSRAGPVHRARAPTEHPVRRRVDDQPPAGHRVTVDPEPW